MKKFFLLFTIIIVIMLVGAFGTVVFDILKNQTGDKILAAKDDPIEKLRCPDCNVILIGIDTLRADHLSSYGYFRDTSPNIDKFAEKGVLFKNVFSASSGTAPSFMSMFTSLYPTDHGVLINISSSRKDIYTRVDDSVKTMAEVLRDQGYITKALVNTPQLSLEFGFGKGFDIYEFNELSINRDKLLQWIKDNKDKKFFLFFHDKGPHDPYSPPSPYNSLYDSGYKGNIVTELPDISEIDSRNEDYVFEDMLNTRKVYKEVVGAYFWSNVNKDDPRDIYHLQALYDGEIKYLDDFIGRLQGVLLETGLIKNTIVIFTSDHGEEFFEHGGFIHGQVYNEILKVPLILTSPSIEKNLEINEHVRTVDIMPTIMDFLNISTSISLRGESLLPLIENPARKLDLSAVAMQYDRSIPPTPLYQTIIKGRYKFIRNFTNNKPPYELYDIYSDPKELSNLASEKRDIVLELSNDLQELLNDKQYIYKPILLNLRLDEDRREKLESLGY